MAAELLLKLKTNGQLVGKEHGAIILGARRLVRLRRLLLVNGAQKGLPGDVTGGLRLQLRHLHEHHPTEAVNVVVVGPAPVTAGRLVVQRMRPGVR